jgi:ribosomal protein L29
VCYLFVARRAVAKIKVTDLRVKTKQELEKQLEELKNELSQLRVAQISGNQAGKLAQMYVFANLSLSLSLPPLVLVVLRCSGHEEEFPPLPCSVCLLSSSSSFVVCTSGQHLVTPQSNPVLRDFYGVAISSATDLVKHECLPLLCVSL